MENKTKNKTKKSPQTTTILFFMAIISLFLYFANLAVYEVLVNIFTLTTLWRGLLVVLLSVLSGSFVVANILGMRYYNTFTRLYYYLSALWIAFFVYLFLVSVTYGLLTLLFVTLPNIVGEILIVGALVISIYGIFRARNIIVTHVDIVLPNLPDSWRGRRAVWISDLHLGQVHGSSFARRVVEKIKILPPDIIFIGGDLYDGTGAPDINELISPFKNLSAPLGVYFITGNHEEFGNSEAFVDAVRRANIRPLIDELVEIDGMQIIGVDYHNALNKERFRNILSGLAISDKPSILLKHEPKDLDVASEVGISLQISGHTHQAQMWPLGYVAGLVYNGFSYGLKRFGKMQVYTSSGIGTWGPPIRVGTHSEIVVFTFV